MSPECQNCGHRVTKQYERVFAPDDADGVRCCPWCEDKVRKDGEVTTARSSRSAARTL